MRDSDILEAMSLMVPDAVRRRAALSGAEHWLDRLPQLVAELADEWRLHRVGDCFPDATEAYAIQVVCADTSPAVLKLAVPQGAVTAHEITALRLADGHGAVRLLRHDATRGALLLERLGPSMHDLSLPTRERETHLVRALETLWRCVDEPSLPTSIDKGRELVRTIEANWRATGYSTPDYVVRGAQQAARNRVAAGDTERNFLLHGDAHQWNALQSAHGFTLVDPDGLVGEREYDLAVLVREDPLDPDAEPREQTLRLAQCTGTDAEAIWQWSIAERVNTGLLLLALGMTHEGNGMLQAAQQIADDEQLAG